MKDFLQDIAKEHGLCLKLLGLEKQKGYCFYYHLGFCKGACSGRELVVRYNVRFEQGFSKHKIKQWPFSGAILVKESGEFEQAYVIDKWCVLGSVRDGESLTDLDYAYIFDIDAYNILSNYLTTRKNLQGTRLE